MARKSKNHLKGRHPASTPGARTTSSSSSTPTRKSKSSSTSPSHSLAIAEIMDSVGMHITSPGDLKKGHCMNLLKAALDVHFVGNIHARPHFVDVKCPSSVQPGSEAASCLAENHRLGRMVQQNKGYSTHPEKAGAWQVFCHTCNRQVYRSANEYPLINNQRVQDILEALHRVSAVSVRTPAKKCAARQPPLPLASAVDSVPLVNALDEALLNNFGPVPAALRLPSDFQASVRAPSEVSDTGSHYIAASPLVEAVVYTKDGLVMPRNLDIRADTPADDELVLPPLLLQSDLGDSDKENKAMGLANVFSADPHARAASVISISSTETSSSSEESEDVRDIGNSVIVVVFFKKGELPVIFKAHPDTDERTSHGFSTLCLADYMHKFTGTGFPMGRPLERYLPGLGRSKQWVKYRLTKHIIISPRDDVVYIRIKDLPVRLPDHVLDLVLASQGVREVLLLD
ncbi:hypothetical protein C8F01DRAFT_1376723 [Mycena amicta]|nr:hypothetical protein C8F01DRAFT_1376723 [Mycena amicta]